MSFVVLLAQATPFFTNDQWGLLKVLLVIVVPIITTIGGALYALDKRKLRADVTALGRKVDDRHRNYESRFGDLDGRVGAVERAMQAHTVATITAVNDAKEEVTRDVTKAKEELLREIHVVDRHVAGLERRRVDRGE